MLDANQLHELADQVRVVREKLDAALPLAISDEAIAAIAALPEDARVCRQAMSHALLNLSHATLSLTTAAFAAEGIIMTIKGDTEI